jgi:hypothetical protein
LDHPSRRAIEVGGDEEQERDECRGERDREYSPPDDRQIRREQPQGKRGAEYFEHENGGRDPIAERGDTHGLPVDHLVQRLNVEAWRACRWRGPKSFSCERSQPTFNPLLMCAGAIGLLTARHLLRDADGAPRIADQQVKRAAADRLRQGLGAQVCRADRVRLVDDVRAAILVAGDSERESEGEEQANDTEQRALQDAKRLFETVRKVPNAAAQENPEPGCAED